MMCDTMVYGVLRLLLLLLPPPLLHLQLSF
jgi:hypothetical protein